MNAHSHRSIIRRRNLVPLTVFFLLSLVAFFGFAASGAHPQDDGAATAAHDGREFKVEIPERLPIKVKLKSEKSFKDSKNKRWLRELEVEVKNTGTKPIYYVALHLGLPDVYVGGPLLTIGMQYGRKELFFPETPVEPGDVPIMPGETITMRPGAQSTKAFEYHRDELKDQTDPKRVECVVTAITFGDGTGLWGRNGTLPPPERISSNAPAQKNGAGGCRSSQAPGPLVEPGALFKVSNSWQPASILRAYFLPPVDAPAPAPES
ncbi:MAG TPA: hypothetical protein VF591_16255 [Pyrinomonadaceae bacterium]|jgi:hypothetical protein